MSSAPAAPPASRAPLWGLLVAQFTNAFNDNAWKLMVPLLAMGSLATSDPAYDAVLQQKMTLAMLVFTLPLILLSLPAGAIADRIGKRSILLALKFLEVLLMVGACLAVYRDPTGVLPLIIVCCLALQSALFSPAKYGILPEFLPHDRLSSANGILSMWTFVAIVLGTFVGGFAGALEKEQAVLATAALLALAIVGCAAAVFIPQVAPAGGPRSVRDTISGAVSAIRADRTLGRAILGSVCYWGLVSLLGQDVLVYSKALTRDLGRVQLAVFDWTIDLDKFASLPMAVYAIGVGLGSITAGWWSAGKIEKGLIPLGALLFGAMTLLVALLRPGFVWTCTLMVPLGFASGFIVVPLNALVQWRAPADRRGAVIAVENVLVFTAVLGGSLLAGGMASLGLSMDLILLVSALLTLGGTLLALKLLPDALLRLILVILTHTLYRLRVIGREHVPQQGGALLVPNHVSFVDGLFVMATLDRPVRFLVAAEYFNHPLLRPFMRSLGAVPISSSGEPRTIMRALKDAGTYLDRGELVCIFAEGQITRTGMLLPFRRGLERIVKGRSAPIVPMHLERVWGSIFSREGGRFLTKIPKRIPYPVTVAYGEPLPPGTDLHVLRQRVQELGSHCWTVDRSQRRPLHHNFVRCCRWHPLKFLYADPMQPRGLSRIKGLIGAVALARALRRAWAGQQHVGLLLPPSVAAAVANVAAALAGRVSVNLNYTAGTAGMASARQQANLTKVLTSRRFVDKAGLQLPDGLQPLWIEDIAATIGPLARLWATLLAVLAPLRLLERACGAPRASTVDDLVTIIFSSGSTGDPKGVMLSHFNVSSNVDAASQILRFEREDRLVGILPLFHSFGYAALWFTNNHGMGMAFHPNPTDAAAIGQLIEHYRLTILVATPTFLHLYMRRCTPAQFGSLRLVVVGAEKLQPQLAQAFEDTFGIRPLEGYGTTECSPVISCNVLDFRAPGFYQPGSRRGSVGQPLPGVAVRVVDPETFAPLSHNQPGMLLVKGPNVMEGYLGRQDLTAEVMRDGWYVTGDIAVLDEDSFITITDRLSRFSKIGGEMVPHGGIEQALHDALETEEPAFVVTSVTDPRKGESLAVLYTVEDHAIPAVLEHMNEAGLPKLYVPRRDHFIRVDEIPRLGTGKLDLSRIKAIAEERLSRKDDAS